MEGWIKLHRQISDNPLWTCEKFTRGQAWVDLLILANHKDNFFYKRGVKVDVKRGQVGWSCIALSERWSWSRSKVSKFLNDLEKEQQITQQKTNVTQVITLINYDLYQSKEQQTEQQKYSRNTAKEQQKDTNKNDNNVNKEKNDNNEKKKQYKKSLLSSLKNEDVDDSEYLELTLAFKDLFRNNLIEKNISTTQIDKAKGTWIDSIRLLLETDNYTKEDLRTVWSFLKKDEFWKKNILSTSKLREKFQTLLFQAKQPKKEVKNYANQPTDYSWLQERIQKDLQNDRTS